MDLPLSVSSFDYLGKFGLDAPVCSARVSALASCGRRNERRVGRLYCDVSELLEQSCGVHAVAFFEARQFAFHNGEEEPDDGSAVVGLFHDDVMDRFGEIGLLFILCYELCEHGFEF